MPHLFDPFTLREVTLRNRIGMSPMCQYCAVDGYANDWHLVHYATRAIGGAGLIIVEATAVEPRGRITPDDLGIWDDSHIEPLRRIVGAMKEHGAVPGIQIAHAGRKASTHRPWGAPASGALSSDDPRSWQTVGPSQIPFKADYSVPQALTPEEIQKIEDAFGMAARRALAAGFEWLEIHGAHGYLLHSFYSPLTNQRTDIYGGSFENRTRFLLETATKVRQVWPENLPLTVRLSCTDWVENGWNIADSVVLAQNLHSIGVDLIDCSSGGNIPNPPAVISPGYQVPFADTIRQQAAIATAAIGLITTPDQASGIVGDGHADIVLLGRELLRNPYWPLHTAKALERVGLVPGQYLRGF